MSPSLKALPLGQSLAREHDEVQDHKSSLGHNKSDGVQEHGRRKADFRINNHIVHHVTTVLTDRLLLTGTGAAENHHSLRIALLLLIPLNYPSSVPFSLCVTNISDFPQLLFLGKPSTQELNQASRIHCISPYLCPDCSETWTHSPHYR